MNFQGQGLPLSRDGMKHICDTLGVSEPQVWAVLTVETRGFGFLPDRRPQILFERHIFHNLTDGRFDAGNSDISNPKTGGYISGAGEYPRLEKAMSLDQSAALQSASWGIGQVMGFNYQAAGYNGVDDMITDMIKGENAQLMAMANFIKSNHLDSPLQRQNWETFARGYNGTDFKKNAYDRRLAAAHAQFNVSTPDLALRTAQVALLYLGLDPGPIDGTRGRRTNAALLQFQEQSGLPETGELDDDTDAKLRAEAFGG